MNWTRGGGWKRKKGWIKRKKSFSTGRKIIYTIWRRPFLVSLAIKSFVISCHTVFICLCSDISAQEPLIFRRLNKKSLYFFFIVHLLTCRTWLIALLHMLIVKRVIKLLIRSPSSLLFIFLGGKIKYRSKYHQCENSIISRFSVRSKHELCLWLPLDAIQAPIVNEQ